MSLAILWGNTILETAKSFFAFEVRYFGKPEDPPITKETLLMPFPESKANKFTEFGQQDILKIFMNKKLGKKNIK